MTTAHASSWRLWTLAARPRTLPAAVAPVIVGSAVAIHGGGFSLIVAILALLTALLLQIAANFANDTFDFRRGADTEERLGPTRVTAAGLLTPEAVLRATLITLALSVIPGTVLVARGGGMVLLLGVAAIVCAGAYTGGPFPLGYLGLGELFVFFFFGPVAVTGTAWLHTLELTPLSVAASVPVGALATAILVVNHLRDLPTDRSSGKRTVAVRIGAGWTRIEYGALLLIALVAPIGFWMAGWLDWWWILTVGSWPLAWRLRRQIRHNQGRELNRTLGPTAQMQLVYSVLLAVALMLG